MAVAFDTFLQNRAAGANGTLSVTGSIGANANRGIAGILRLHHTVAGVTALTITWAGVGLTQKGSVDQVGGANPNCIFLFELHVDAQIATGNQTLTANWTGGAMDASLGLISLSGVDQTTGFQNVTTATGSSTTPAVTVTSANGNIVVAGHTDDDASSTSVTSPGVMVWDERGLAGNDSGVYKPSTTGSTTINWTLGSSKAWAVIGMDAIAAAAAGEDEAVLHNRARCISVPSVAFTLALAASRLFG